MKPVCPICDAPVYTTPSYYGQWTCRKHGTVEPTEQPGRKESRLGEELKRLRGIISNLASFYTRGSREVVQVMDLLKDLRIEREKVLFVKEQRNQLRRDLASLQGDTHRALHNKYK